MNPYLQQIARYPLLCAEEEIECAEKIREGDPAARQKMILSNLRLVIKIAGRYANLGVPIADLISEGNIGLIKATDRFDPTKGVRFGAYAVWWIKQSIFDALTRQGATIRLPSHLVNQLTQVRNIVLKLTGDLGREPRDDEIARSWGRPEEKIRFLRRVSQRTVSLDTPVGDDGAAVLGDTIGDESAVGPGELLVQNSAATDIRTMLGELNTRETEIIRHRFGFDGEKAKTLDEIGELLGISAKRVGQIQVRALSKLRDRIPGKKTGPVTGEFLENQIDRQSLRKIQMLLESRIRKKNLKPRSRTASTRVDGR